MSMVLINTIFFLFYLSLLLSVYVIIKRVKLDHNKALFKEHEKAWEELLFSYLISSKKFADIESSVKLHELYFLKFLLRFFEVLEGDERKKLVQLYHKLNLDKFIEGMKSSKINAIKKDGLYLFTYINHFIKSREGLSFKELFFETIDSPFFSNRRLLMELNKYQGSTESDLNELLTSDLSDEKKSRV